MKKWLACWGFISVIMIFLIDVIDVYADSYWAVFVQGGVSGPFGGSMANATVLLAHPLLLPWVTKFHLMAYRSFIYTMALDLERKDTPQHMLIYGSSG